MYKKLIVGKEPEQTKLYCECGNKYRSCIYWSYLENGIDKATEELANKFNSFFGQNFKKINIYVIIVM